MTTQGVTKFTEEHENVVSVIQSLYRTLGNRPAFDRHLHPSITIWESDAQRLLWGTEQLDRLRDERAAAACADEAPTSVAPESVIVDVWGDTAVARYVLRVRRGKAAVLDECYRVTDVLRRCEGVWLIVHHHSESTGNS